MKPLIIAINAKFIHTNNAIRLLKVNSTHEIDLLEFTIKDSIEDILNAIKGYNPLFIGFSTYIWNVKMVKTLAKEIMHTPVVLGGPEVSYDPSYFLTYADIIVKGEGEHVFDAIVEHYKYDKPLDDVPSISTNLVNNPIEEIKDLNTLTMPYTLEEDRPHLNHKIAYIESSRGCPYKCSYCLSSLEKKVRFFNPETVKSSILYLMENGAKTFKFLDRTFNANKQMFELIDFIIDHHIEGTVFQFEITGDTLDPKIVYYIHDHAPKNLFRFEIGIQSTNEETNLLVDRVQNNEKLFSIIKLIESKKIIDLHLDLIAGLPKEDLARFKDTFDQVYTLGSKELQLGFLKMLRGTKIRYQAELFDYHYESEAPYEIIQNRWLTQQDIQTIKNAETMLNIVHNKGFFGLYLWEIIMDYFDSSFDFFDALYHHFKSSNTPLLHYQLDEVFKTVESFLTLQHLPIEKVEQLRIIYLKRSKVRPKVYFELIKDKQVKKHIYTQLTYYHPINVFYKNALVLKVSDGYVVALYQNMQAYLYKVTKKESYLL